MNAVTLTVATGKVSILGSYIPDWFMKRLFIIWILFVSFLTPLLLSAQHISISKLLSLQRSSLINIQDYIETSPWKLKGITSLKVVDSIIFQSHTQAFLDSIARIRRPEGSPLTARYNYAQLTASTQFDAPAWIEYLSLADTKINSTTLFTNSLTITLPKFYLFHAINQQLRSFDKHTFNHALRLSFGDQQTFKNYLNEISVLQVAENDSYVMYNTPLITRVYKLNDQVINLIVFNTPTPSYALAIYSRADYDYLHAAEQELKGKSDFIH